VKLLVLAAAFAGALLAVGGVGYAWGDHGGCHGDRHHGCGTETGIEWVNPTTIQAAGKGLHCTVAPTSSVLTTSGGPMFPGTLCFLNATLENVGEQSVELVPHISAHLPSGCSAFTYSDNLLSASPEVQLRAGHSFAYHAQFGLSASAGNGCEGAVGQFQVTISTSGSPSCDGFPNAASSLAEGRCCG